MTHRRGAPGGLLEALRRRERHDGRSARAVEVTAPVPPVRVAHRHVDGASTVARRRAA